MSSMIADAIDAVATDEVQALIRELGKYGLGVFMPHIHTSDGFAPMPSDTVQLEAELKVTFVRKNDPRLVGAAPVGWVWDESQARVAAICMCTGGEHDPHWNRPRPK
jgi:hypothetical protein